MHFFLKYTHKNRGVFKKKCKKIKQHIKNEYLCLEFLKKYSMAIIRFTALTETLNRKPVNVELPADKISQIYATNVFGKTTMKQYLSSEAYESVIGAMEKGIQIDRKMADQVASAMRAWAAEKGATHYTHWFSH
jgi:hypothetical protein